MIFMTFGKLDTKLLILYPFNFLKHRLVCNNDQFWVSEKTLNLPPEFDFARFVKFAATQSAEMSLCE